MKENIFRIFSHFFLKNQYFPECLLVATVALLPVLLLHKLPFLPPSIGIRQKTVTMKSI